MLLASAATVLLMTCANLASRRCSRGRSRAGGSSPCARPWGRGAGASSGSYLTETAVLGLAGGALGLLLSQGDVVAPARSRTRRAAGSRRAVARRGCNCAVMAVVALGAGLAFGVVPALAVGRWDALGALRGRAQRGRGPASPPPARPARRRTDGALRQPARRRGSAGAKPLGDDGHAARLRPARRAGGAVAALDERLPDARDTCSVSGAAGGAPAPPARCRVRGGGEQGAHRQPAARSVRSRGGRDLGDAGDGGLRERVGRLLTHATHRCYGRAPCWTPRIKKARRRRTSSARAWNDATGRRVQPWARAFASAGTR